jgi:hypothetical protein
MKKHFQSLKIKPKHKLNYVKQSKLMTYKCINTKLIKNIAFKLHFLSYIDSL